MVFDEKWRKLATCRPISATSKAAGSNSLFQASGKFSHQWAKDHFSSNGTGLALSSEESSPSLESFIF
jgi:hypothetical protein